MSFDLPDPPGEWVISTNKEQAVIFYWRADGRAIHLMPTRGSADGWTVLGTAQYDTPLPTFAADVGFEAALDAAVAEMEARERGETTVDRTEDETDVPGVDGADDGQAAAESDQRTSDAEEERGDVGGEGGDAEAETKSEGVQRGLEDFV